MKSACEGRRERRTAAGFAHWRFDLAVLCVAALLHGLLFWIDGHPASRSQVGDERMYYRFAAQSWQGGAATFDLFWPPLYAWFLRPFVLFAPSAPTVIALTQIGLLLLAAYALRSLASSQTGSEEVGRFAWALFLVDPQVAAFAHYFWPEILHVAIFLGMIWLLASHTEKWRWLLAAGLLLGAALLTKSLLFPFVPVLLSAIVLDGGWRRGIARALTVALVACLVTLPTIVENGHRYGTYVIANSGLFNLWLGLNDVGRHASMHTLASEEYAHFHESGNTFAEKQAALTAKLESLWQRRGALALLQSQMAKQYFRLLDRDSFLTDQLPGGAVSARRVGGYVDTSPALSGLLRLWSFGVYALVLAFAGPGLVATPLRGRHWLTVLWLFLAYNLVLFLGLHVRSRFRVQFLPVLDVAAAIGLASLVDRLRGERATLLAPRRAGCGIALSALFLFLAFAGPYLP